MDSLEKAMDNLKCRGDASTVTSSLDELLETLEAAADRDACVSSVVEAGVMPELLHQLKKESSNSLKVTKLIAELAKSECAREPAVQAGLVPPLLTMLDDPDTDKRVQACRALGNICFDNDSGRSAIDEINGVERLINLQRSLLQSTDEGAEKLRTVACGFLLNLTNTHESVQEKALSLGAMEILDEYLRRHRNEEGVVQMALLSIGSLAEADMGREKMMECEIAVTISQLLGTEVGTELQDTVLELLATIAELDEIKEQLAKSDLTDRLLALIDNSSKDEDGLQTQKLASDLIILLLTGDSSMDVLYNKGNGRVYKESLTWLQSSSPHLKVCGALAVGNFARNDEHCIHLVEQGIADKLLALLDEDVTTMNPTLLHAVFSSLRNLAIPAVNKPVLLECGLIKRVLPHSASEMTQVHFKLLGTLRLAIDGQESSARELGTNIYFLEKLVKWCKMEEHPGVKGEATRLVACLIKQCHNETVLTNLVKHGAIPHLVDMVNSEHMVMQNEALLALTILSSVVLGTISVELAGSELLGSLKLLLTEKATRPEIISNVLTLVNSLATSDEMKHHMMIGEFPCLLRSLQSHEDCKVQEQAKAVSHVFN